MTHAQLRTELLRAVGENPAAPVFHTAAAATAALNAAQQVYAAMTLCIETSATLSSNGWTASASAIPRLIVPLRVRYGFTRLQPRTVNELQALSANWLAHVDAPDSYLWLGWDLFRPYPVPTGGPHGYSVLYAASPAPLVADNDVSQIPAEDHQALLHYAVPRLRLAEGGSELAKGIPRLSLFLDAVKKRAAMVQARMRDLNYDTRPAERFLLEMEARWRSTLPVS